MLRLLSLLQTHRYWPGPELAGRLEVSPRTLRRDVDRLRDLGYTVDAVRGAAGGYQLAPAVAPAVAARGRRGGGRRGRSAHGGDERGGRHRRPLGPGAGQGAGPHAAAAAPADGRRLLADRDARHRGGSRPSTRRSSPRSPRPAATTSWSSSTTPRARRRPRTAGPSRSASSLSAAGGTSSPTTAIARTGAASGSTGSRIPAPPA